MVKASDIGMSPFNSAEENTEAFVKWLDGKNKNTTLHLNSVQNNVGVFTGRYKINSLADKGLDLRYLSIKGDGIRSSVFMYESEYDLPLFESGTLFEVVYQDFQIRDRRSPEKEWKEPLLRWRSGRNYGNIMRNVYFRDSVADGVELNGGQGNVFDRIVAKHNNGYGVKMVDQMNTVLREPWSEANGTGSILVEAVNTQGGGRFNSTGIRIQTPYMENNPVGVHIKGVNGVHVTSGFNSGGPFVKISKGVRYAHYNLIEGNYRNHVEIEDGNHSNHVINTHPTDSRLSDYDGRTYLNGYNPFTTYDEFGSLFDDPMEGENFQFKQKRTVYKDEMNVYLSMKSHPDAFTSLSLYDLANKEFYNFCTKQWQTGLGDEGRLLIRHNGGINNLKVTAETQECERQVYVKLFTPKYGLELLKGNVE